MTGCLIERKDIASHIMFQKYQKLAKYCQSSSFKTDLPQKQIFLELFGTNCSVAAKIKLFANSETHIKYKDSDT